jgi:soluble lytic murein transglycosylase-like protein
VLRWVCSNSKKAPKTQGARAALRRLLMMELILAQFFGSAVRADVIEIGPDGQTSTYRSPSIFTSEGVRTLTDKPIPRRSYKAPLPAKDVELMLSRAARHYRLDEDLLKAVAWRESRFNRLAISSRGAFGVMQLMKITARQLNVNRLDLAQNIMGGAAYLRSLLDRYSGDPTLALAAYNAGPEAVDRSHGVPEFPETQKYVRDILMSLSPPTSPALPDR